MTNKLDQIELDRHRRNLVLFVISYTLSNLISGIIYDAYINYLQEVAIDVSTHFWSYYGYATFISAIMVLLVNRIGYKWTLLFCPMTLSLSLISLLYFQIDGLYKIMTVLVLVGLQLHYVLLAPFIANYSRDKDQDKWYSRAYWIGYSGWALTTFLGGFLTVFFFSARAGLTFGQGRLLTENISKLDPLMRNFYLAGNRDVLFLTGILAIISIIPVLLMKEKTSDYYHSREKLSFKAYLGDFKKLMNKYSLTYIIYIALISFGMGLFTPYFTVFLNRNLFIDRSTASLLVSISYSALVLFVMVSPRLVGRFGRINTMTATVLLSIPFMLIIANGNVFGKFMLPMVGMALFMRSGLANLSSPIESAIGMEVVSKDLRPAMSSLVNIVTGLVSILSGKFTGLFLFKSQVGYKWGYYLASILYILAILLLNFVFKDYKREAGEIDGQY